MSENQPSQPDYDQPVAYDVDGHPLYLHPSTKLEQPASNNQTQAVRMVRPSEPDKLVISEDTRLKHEQSKRAFPECDLSDGEYVISSVSRHPIGLLLPLVLGVFLISLALILLFNFDLVIKSLNITDPTINSSIIILPVLVFITLVLAATYVAYYVYSNNKLFLTNESIIQVIQAGMLSRKEKMVGLEDIEDVSFTQTGIIQHVFNFGSIRLSTEGEGTIYRYNYVANPKEAIATLKNAVESFKYGRSF